MLYHFVVEALPLSKFLEHDLKSRFSTKGGLAYGYNIVVDLSYFDSNQTQEISTSSYSPSANH